MNDLALMRKIEIGDEDAIREFVRSRHPSLCGFLFGLTGSVEDAEDLTQQAFIKACLYAGTFESRSSATTWLHRIAFREYTHWKRSRVATVRLAEDAPLRDDVYQRSDELIVLDEALCKLPEDQREAWLLVEGAGLTLDETAKTLGVALGTAKSRVYHARRRLRALLEIGTGRYLMEKEQGHDPIERCAQAVLDVREAIAHWKLAILENRPPESGLLTKARMAFAGAFREGSLSADEARTGVELYHYLLNDKKSTVALLDRYLVQSLDVEEEAWARRERLVARAALVEGTGVGPVTEFVDEHRAFARWFRETLAPSRLLGFIVGPTEAVCWREAGCGNEWFSLLDEAVAHFPVEESTRWERMIAFRTAATAARFLEDEERHARYLGLLFRLADEDPRYIRNAEILVEGWGLELLLAQDQGRVDGPAVVAKAREALSAVPCSTKEQRHRVGVAVGNLAAAFFFSQLYAESIEFGQRSIELAPYYEHTFLRLAAAKWATGGSRKEVLGLLRRGAEMARCGSYDIRNMAEFANVRDDPEFLAAQTLPE